MQFVCRVGTSDGRILEDVFEAADEAALRQQLTQRGYHLFDLRRRGPVGKLRLPTRGRTTTRIGLRELTLFNQELAALLRSGLPMLQALDLMLERQKDPVFHATLRDVRDRVKSGEDLSNAIGVELSPRGEQRLTSWLEERIDGPMQVGSTAVASPLRKSWGRSCDRVPGMFC